MTTIDEIIVGAWFVVVFLSGIYLWREMRRYR